MAFYPYRQQQYPDTQQPVQGMPLQWQPMGEQGQEMNQAAGQAGNFLGDALRRKLKRDASLAALNE